MVINAQMRARELLHTERQAAIAKGLPPPDEPPDKPGASEGGAERPDRAAGKELGTGLLWLFVGVGTIVALRIVNPASSSWGWGVIPVALGLAYLVGIGLSSWQAARIRKDDGVPQDSRPR
jgi:hypothetical protein